MERNPAPVSASSRTRNLVHATVVVAAFAASHAQAAQQALAWDASADSSVAGYYVYYGSTSHNYPNRLDVQKQTSYTVPSLAEGGTYYFAVAAYNATGAVSPYSNEVSKTIPAVTVTAGLTATPTSGKAPLAVTFTSVSSGTITSYLWDFGDGTTSTSQNATHTYKTDGTFTFTLRVTGPSGSSTATGSVTTTCQWRNNPKRCSGATSAR